MTTLYLFCLLIINLLWSGALYLTGLETTLANYAYNLSYGLNFVLACVVLFKTFKQTSRYRFAVGVFFSAYVFAALAQLIWFGFNAVFQIEVPYPGLADFFWVFFYILLGMGFCVLAWQMRTQLNWTHLFEFGSLSLLLFGVIVAFLQTNGVNLSLETTAGLFNLLYIVLDAVLVSLSVLVMRLRTQTKSNSLLYLTFGLFVLVLADTTFSYQMAADTYWNGNIADVLYAVSAFLFALSTVELLTMLKSQQSPNLKDSFQTEGI